MDHNFLIIGDLHIQEKNIDETHRIIDFLIKEYVETKKVVGVVFMGDAWHAHAILNQNVCDAMRKIVRKLATYNLILHYVVGNHDNQNPRGGTVNAAHLILNNLPITITGYTGFDQIQGTDMYCVGFRSQEGFIQTCEEIYKINSNSIILHHQTIDGFVYESGMPAYGGIDPAKLPNKMFIGGHAHVKKFYGKIFYVGTPRSLTFSDVNERKGVHIFNANTLSFEFVDLNHLSKCFYSQDIYEGQLENDEIKANPEWKAGDDIKLHIYGSKDFYKRVYEKNKGLQKKNIGKVSFIPHIKKIADTKIDTKMVETDIMSAFKGYVFDVYNADAEIKNKIWKEIEEMKAELNAK